MSGSDKITVPTLRRMADSNTPIAALSLYDFPYTRLAEDAGVEMAIVGDSALMTVLGLPNTLRLPPEQVMTYMETIAGAVARAAKRMFVVGDLPFGSYQSSDALAIRSAERFVNAGCNAAKCEANMRLLPRFKALADSQVAPVMGHIGLNPQKIHEMGGYRIQGKTVESTLELVTTAKALEDAGAFALLLEGVTEEVSALIRSKVKMPVYGIASGKLLHGQLLISYDPLALYDWGERLPIHVKHYKPESTGGKAVADLTLEVFKEYVREVKAGEYPANSHHLSVAEFHTSNDAYVKTLLEDFRKLADSEKFTVSFYEQLQTKIKR